MTEQTTAPSVFTLTSITGRRKFDDREQLVATFEVNRRFARTALLGLIPTIPIAALAGLIIGVWAIFLAAVVMALWLLLVYRRSRHGLQLRTLETMVDRRRTLAGKFVQCGVVINRDHYDPYQVMSATAPVHRPPEVEDPLLLLGESPEAVKGPAVDVAAVRRALRHGKRQLATTSVVDDPYAALLS